MAWNPPRSWSVGELVSAATMNEQVRDNLTVLKQPIDDNGKVRALNSTYLADVSGAALTGVMKTTSGNEVTAGTHNFNAGAGTRLVVPVGADKWST